ncbi:neck protein [Synechococcus phage S-8S53]|nr:neck protein [Synechococcus phage S-8S53]
MTPLNPFFRQEVASEQRLVQDLVNEHLRMYGQEIYYLPRKYVGNDKIMRENILSRFDDAYALEAYIANVDGFQGSGDLMTKFGIRVTDDATFIVSRERFEDYIMQIISTVDDTEDLRMKGDKDLGMRPMEGDLIYFALSDSLFEIKFVEHESPFYQLGSLYTYELRCELFEYEDEVFDTEILDIDDNAADIGYVVTLNLAGVGVTATAIAGIATGSVIDVIMIDDGYGFSSRPTVAISSSPSTLPFADASAVAITTIGAGRTTYSIQEVQILNPGFGYTVAPTITFVGDGFAKARTEIAAVGAVKIDSYTGGIGYRPNSTVTVAISTSPAGLGTANATAEAQVSAAGTVGTIRFTNAGFGYTIPPTINLTSPFGTRRATANVGFNSVTGLGQITTLTLTDVGLAYTTAPVITISDPSGFRAGILTASVGVGTTVTSISITNPGAAYTVAPTLTIASPAAGTTATATAFINTTTGIITGVTVTNPGTGYTSAPTITLTGGIGTALVSAFVNVAGIVTGTNIDYVGAGYTRVPTATFASPFVGVNTGTFIGNEIITGQTGLATARVKDWNEETKVLKVYRVAGDFRDGETIVGSATTLDGVDTTGSYILNSIVYEDADDDYNASIEFEDEGEDIIDFTETNPFGTF